MGSHEAVQPGAVTLSFSFKLVVADWFVTVLLLHSPTRLCHLSLRSKVVFAVSSPVSGFVVLWLETTVRISLAVFQVSFHSSNSGKLHCRKQTGEQLWHAVLQKAVCRSVHPILKLKHIYCNNGNRGGRCHIPMPSLYPKQCLLTVVL